MSYEIEQDAFEVPSLPGGVNVAADEEDAQERIGRDLLTFAKQAVGKRGVFHLALSGGGTPMPLYRRLMIDPLFREMPWSRTHLWIVDERRAPFDSDTNNFKHIDELLVEHADIPRANIHPMPVDRDSAAEDYEDELRETLAIGGVPGDPERGRLDFVLLGMGPDGHTASLFPHTAALNEEDRWVVDNDGARRPMRKEGDRVSQERAFSDVGNFARAPDSTPIPGNEGAPWPGRDARLWV